MAANHPHIERGHTVAHAVIVFLFRLFVFALFAPIAWHELQEGNIVGVVIGLLCAAFLPSVMAPHKHE